MSEVDYKIVVNGKTFVSQIKETVEELKEMAATKGYEYETQDEDIEDNSWD